MLKEAGGLAVGALVFSPLGMPFFLHGVAGILVGGAELFVADAVLRQVVGNASKLSPQSGNSESGEQNLDLRNSV